MSEQGPSKRGRVVRRRWHLVALVTMALIAFVLVSCTPSQTPLDPNSLPKDINLMTDTQVEQSLAYLAPSIIADFDNPRIRALIPSDKLPAVQQTIDSLKTPEGIASLVPFFRAQAKVVPHGLPPRNEAVNFPMLGLSAGDFDRIPVTPSATGTRTPPPSGAGTHDTGGNLVGANVPIAPSSAACGAPGGVGTIAAPAGIVAGQLLTPGRDIFTKTSTGFFIGTDGLLSPTGVDPVAGQGPGIELRPGGLNQQQMHVRIDLEDPKQFGPAALYPLIDIKPIGGAATTEYRPRVTGGQIYCYSGDTRTDRGYFDGWVTIPRAEPGFQLIDEVVENDYFFRCTVDNLAHCDLLLGGPGPQYWAGADRATIHAGAAALSTPAVLNASVGAFATGLPDGVGGPDVLTDNSANTSASIEAPLRQAIDQQIVSKVNSALSGDLFNIGIASAQAFLTKPIDDQIDLKFVNSQTGLTEPGEPTSGIGALHADVTVTADVNLNVDVLSLECDNLATTVTVSLRANAFADSAGQGTGLIPRVDNTTPAVFVDTHPEALQFVNPICDLEELASTYSVGELILGHEVDSGLQDAFRGDNGQSGSLQKMLEGLDLNQYLPTLSLGSATLKPIVTNIDNSWCRSGNAPLGCTNNQDLISANGLSAVADTTMVSSLGQALGGGFEGKFRNVFAPTTFSTVADLTTAHRDLNQQLAGLGTILDPRLLNETLRDLVEGDSTSTASNGLIDVTNYTIANGFTLSTTPAVAPEIIGVPPAPIIACDTQCGVGPFPAPPSRTTVPIVEPDVRVAMTVGPNTGPPVKYSMAASVNAGVAPDPANPLQLHPTLDTAQVDVLITGACKTDYVKGYATSYLLCGRGGAGTGGNSTTGNPISLTDAVAYVANNIILPLAAKSVGNITLPSLDSLLPGFHLSLTNVRLNQRGGFIAVYGQLRPTPMAAIAVSTEQPQPGVTNLRFFPTNLNGFNPGPLTFSWTIKDHTTGQVVSAPPYPIAPAVAVYANTDEFATTDTNFGPGKVADAILKVSQPGITVTSQTTFTWNPPSLPPPGTCPNLGPIFLLRTAAVNNGGGGTGGGAPGCPTG